MVRIRLRRVGAKKQASYRVVVTDQRSPRDGRFIERLGWYNPRTDPPSFKINEARALHWLSVGAQPSEAVSRLLAKMGTFEKYEQVKAGASIEDVVVETVEAEIEEPVPVDEEEDEIAPVDEFAEEANETDETVEMETSEEGQEALGETGDEEEGDEA